MKLPPRPPACDATLVSCPCNTSSQTHCSPYSTSCADSLNSISLLIHPARLLCVWLPRSYVSCVVGCPYQGPVDPRAAADMAAALHDMGCYQVSMGDTIGVGTPASVSKMFEVLCSLWHSSLTKYVRRTADVLSMIHTFTHRHHSQAAQTVSCNSYATSPRACSPVLC